MSDERHETVETVAAEMRNESHAGDESCLEWVGAKIRGYADRIEAAHQREVAELRGERNGILNANASLADDNDRLRREVAELERARSPNCESALEADDYARKRFFELQGEQVMLK